MTHPHIFVVAVTNKGYNYLSNVINNFIRQTYPFKRLMIIFNSSDIKKEDIDEKLFLNGIVDAIVKIIPDESLGYCLNESIKEIPEEYNVWCKMDDDDFYGKNYLTTNLKAMLQSKADIIGRRDMYIYVPEWKKLYLKYKKVNNKFVDWVQGASLFLNKIVFNKVLFPDKKRGSDTQFLLSCKNNGFKIFAAPINDFIVIRRLNNHNHTWVIDLNKYLNDCVYLPTNVSFNVFTKMEGFNNHIV
jgi:GT2 family glycosyltransferase